MPGPEPYDVIVIGGGPAGLAAALWLARYRRRVRLFDAQEPRDKESWAVHGYLGVADPAPLELRRIGRKQARDAGAELEPAVVRSVAGARDDFRVTLLDGRGFRACRILFATGLKDIKPEIPGFDEFYGRGIWHCPDCDGPTIAGKRVGIIGWGERIARYALYFLTWTDDLAILTHSQPPALPADALRTLEDNGVAIIPEALARIVGTDGVLEAVELHDGSRERFDALFFHVASGPGSTMPQELGCATDDEGIVQVDDDFETTVPGVYAAGDLTPGARLVIRAAYEGTRAAVGIHKSLIPESRRI